MVSPFVKAELTAGVSSLGYADLGKYYKDQYCLEALKDLIRYLRRDDDTLGIRRELGQMKLVQTHLMPIICEYHKDASLFDVVLRLTVNLTNPTLLLFNEELPKDKVTRKYYLEHVNHLQSYKPALSSDNFWNVLTDKLKVILVKDPDDRLEDDKLIIERILILIRNILDIPASPEDEKCTDDDASIHDQVLWSMHLSGMEDVLIYLASNDNERHFCMHVMEIISLMLREQNPAGLALAAAQRSVAEQQKDTDDLVAILQKEASIKEAKYKKMTTSRSSIFRGTFSVKDVKSISDRDLIVHKQIQDAKDIDFSRDKKSKRKSARQLPLACADASRRSTLSIRLMLKEFCLQLLNGAYNSLMHVVKDCLVRLKAQDHDESYYLWALKFFMEFNRNSKFRVELVSETMSINLFHYIQTLVDNYSEMIRIDKAKAALWSRRLHLALRAYQELLMTISVMDKHQNSSVKNSARVLKGNLFYVLEYREMCLVLLQNYREDQFSISYLKDLIETTHIFLKLFQDYGRTNRHLIVQKKVRTLKRRKKKTKTKNLEPATLSLATCNFDEIAAEISSALQQSHSLPENASPFDAASDLSMDDQKTKAMGKIQKLLKESNINQAVGLLRASREVWPEGEVFGHADIRPDEELLFLRELFYADLPMEEEEERERENAAAAYSDDAESEGDEIEEEEMAAVRTNEQELKFDDFVIRFAHHKIIYAYCFMLRHYGTNSTLTNHCIAKMFHRIAWDCKVPAMMFQASLFKIFQQILNDPRCQSDSSLKELGKFAVYILRKFEQVWRSNPKVFMELLFWKTAKDAVEIEVGYGNCNENSNGSKSAWTEEQEDELQRLYDEFKDIQDAEQDVVDRVMANLISQERSRRLVIKKMKDMGLISSVKDIARSKKKNLNVRPPRDWSQDELSELTRLFDQVRDSSDPLGLVIEGLSIRRPKQRVKAKILELGLVDDAKHLRKKRPTKEKKSKKKSKSKPSSSHDLLEHEMQPGSDSNSSSSNSSSSSSSGSDSSGGESDSSTAQSPGGRKKKLLKKYGFAHGNVSSLDAGTLQPALKLLIENGHREGLMWLLESLREARDDRQSDDTSEAIPLLPLAQESIKAMDDHNFLNFIAKMGLTPPANEQEQYWRIPATLSVPALAARIELLQGIKGRSESDGSLTTPTNEPQVTSVKRNAVDDEEHSPPAVHKRRRIVVSDSSEDDAADADKQELAAASPPPAPGGRKRPAILSDSDSE